MATKTFMLLALVALLATQPNVRADEGDVATEADEYEDVERALLVVRKSVNTDYVVAGRNVTVTIDIFNAGQSEATGIRLTDSLPADAKLMSGSLGASFAKLAVGGHATHTYVIVPAEGDKLVTLPSAAVEYIAEKEASGKQVGASSQPLLVVRTPMQQLVFHALVAGKYLSLGLAKTPADWRNAGLIFGSLGGLLTINWLVKTVGTARKDSKRKRALASLEK